MREIRCFWLVLSWSGFHHMDRFHGNGHKLYTFCFRKPAKSKQAWPEFHIINRGYYTVARRYEFYVRVSAANEWDIVLATWWPLDDPVFDDFPKISDYFPKISEDFSKLSRRPDERSRTFSDNFRKFPKMSEDCRRLSKTFEEDPKMFRWYTNEFKYNLRDKLDITEVIDIFTCEDIISSHVRITYRFYQFVTTRYTTDFYIIKYFLT